MTRSITSFAVVLCTAVAFAVCPSTSKATTPVGPITISKVAPTPTPSASTLSAARLAKRAKLKKSLAKTSQVGTMSLVVPGTSTAYSFAIEPGFWPTGVTSADAVVKCYQITDINPGSSSPITVNNTQLSVFSGGSSSSASITLTPNGPTQLNLTFPTSTAGKQLLLTIVATAEDEFFEEFYFEGANIVVVEP